VLELDEVERRLRPFGRRYLGVREIPLDALVGTDSRADSFTRDFRPLHAFSRDRMRSLERAFADGAFPPIVTVNGGAPTCLAGVGGSGHRGARRPADSAPVAGSPIDVAAGEVV